MNDFKLPDTYYDPPSVILWCYHCEDCGWAADEDTAERDLDDLKLIELCPECNSPNVKPVKETFQ